MKLLFMALLTILAVQAAQAAYNDTGISLLNNGTVFDIYNLGTEAPSSDGKTHYYLDNTKLDTTGNYLDAEGNPIMYEDVDYGAGFAPSGVEWANMSKRMLADFTDFQVRNYTDWENYTIIYLNATTLAGGRTIRITRRQEINGTQNKINQTTAFCASGQLLQDLFYIEKHFNFTMGDNLKVRMVLNGTPMDIDLTDNKHWIIPSTQTESYFIVSSDDKTLAYEVDNSNGRLYWFELLNNSVIVIRNIGRINGSNQCLNAKNYWVDAPLCSQTCSAGCGFAGVTIFSNTTEGGDIENWEVGIGGVKMGCRPYLNTCRDPGSCATSTGCNGFYTHKNFAGTWVNTTSSTTYIKCDSGAVCTTAGWYAHTTPANSIINNVTLRAEGNLSGSSERLFRCDLTSWMLGGVSDAPHYTTIDRVKPNVTMDIPSNNTICNASSLPYQVNFSCTVSDMGYLGPGGYLNFTVRNATDDTILNSTLFYGSNYSHSWTAMMILYNYTSYGNYTWNCSARDEAQNTNFSKGKYYFEIAFLDTSEGRFFVGVLCLFVIGVYYAKEKYNS
jgi:hypothetical protein